MRLAADETIIRLGNVAVALRPSLRAALRLERRYGGFDALARMVMDGSLTAIADVIRECATNPHSVATFLETVTYGTGLHAAFEVLIPPLLSHVMALAGVDPDQAGSDVPAAVEPITFAEFHTQLFRIATGWLGWMPADAWDATPAEIIEAHRGRIEMLKAVFGGADDAGSDTPSKGEFRDGIAQLRALAGLKVGDPYLGA